LAKGGHVIITRLLCHEYVPLGFEIVIDRGSHAELGHKGESVPGSKGGIWNLWWNITLSDNPQTWDDEVKAINKMQERLSGLTDDYSSYVPRWPDSAVTTPIPA
jgi:hypothetical protein